MHQLPKEIFYTTISWEQAQDIGFSQQDCGEFDAEEDIVGVIEEITKYIGVTPIRVGYGADLVSSLMEYRQAGRHNILWNLNQGLYGRCREAQVPTLCELLNIPIVGPQSWSAFSTQDKVCANLIIKERGIDIGIPKYTVIDTFVDVNVIEKLLRQSKYSTLIVKPRWEGSSRGIDDRSVVTDVETATKKIRAVLDKWGPVILQEYIDGYDVSSDLATNDDGSLFPLEPVLIKTTTGILPAYMKTMGYEGLPPYSVSMLREFDVDISKKSQKLAMDVGKSLGARHYFRIDFRLDANDGQLYFLEANITPSFCVDSFYVISGNMSGYPMPRLFRNFLSAAHQSALETEYSTTAFKGMSK